MVLLNSTSQITLNVNPLEVKVNKPVKISGRVDPPISVNIILVYVKPDGNVTMRKIRTSADGTFNTMFTPDNQGVWEVYAFWPGNDRLYLSYSPFINLAVTKAEITLTTRRIRTTSLTLAWTQEPTTDTTTDTTSTPYTTITYPLELTDISVLVIFIVVLVILKLIIRKRTY